MGIGEPASTRGFRLRDVAAGVLKKAWEARPWRLAGTGEKGSLPMRLNRTAVLALAAGSILFPTAFGADCVVYAQEATTPLQLSPAPASTQSSEGTAPAKRPGGKARKAQPQKQAQAPKPAGSQPTLAAQPAPSAQPTPAVAAAQPAPAAQPTPESPASAGQPAPTVFDEQARQGQLATCAKVFGALGRGLAADAAFTARTQWDSKAADAHSVQSIVALSRGSGDSALESAGVVFTAPVGGACEGTMVRVTPANDNCQTLAAALGKLNGQSASLGDLALIALPNGAQIVLVPFGNACIAVTTLRTSG
jgi:hypothetical protein